MNCSIHTIEHLSDCERSKGWHQNPMGELPVVFAIARSEKAVVGTVSDLVQSGGDGLGESLFIADFIYQIA